MKQIFTILALIPVTMAGYSQAITITAADMPVPASDYTLTDILATNPANPAVGVNQTWNYSSNTGTTLNFGYFQEQLAFFTSQGIEIYYQNFPKNLNAQFSYYTDYEIDFNANGIDDKGLYVGAQSYALTNFTGSNLDSIKFPNQGYILSSPRRFIQFPFTNGSAWSSSSRRSVDFTLDVAAAGLVATPCQHVWYFNRKDTIVGYGTMRVYTTQGPSQPYDVLMSKIHQWAVDSFYVAGAPAPAQLQTAFSISQGQITNEQYRYNFYRKGTYCYLFSANYGTDATYSTPIGVWTEAGEVNNSIENEAGAEFSTILFPNPTNGGVLNLQIIGKSQDYKSFGIFSMQGQKIQGGSVNFIGEGLIQIQLNEGLAAGNYSLQILNSTGKPIITESFIHQ